MMNRCIGMLAFIALFAGALYPANIHMMSYRVDPEPHPHQDFDLYLTFKNDQDYAAEHVRIYLDCPEGLECVNLSATMPSYGLQEFRFPIKSNATSGVKVISVLWEDGSSRFAYNESSGFSQSEIERHGASVAIRIKDYSMSNFTATPLLYAGENGGFEVDFAANGLNNVQASLYSDCISFEKPLAYFATVSGNATMQSPAYANCKKGNEEVIFSLSSDEISYAVPLNVRIDARPHAKMTVLAKESGGHYAGKDYYCVLVTNLGAKAERVTLSILSNPAVNAPDVIYLGDMESGNEKTAVFELEVKKPGEYPVSVEAKWAEGKESFSKVFDSEAAFADGNANLWLVGVGICMLAILYFMLRRKQ